MPQKVVEIPGYGDVEFPDSMSEAQINAAAKRLWTEKNLKPILDKQAAKYPSSQEMGAKGQGVGVTSDMTGNLKSVPASQAYGTTSNVMTNLLGSYDRNVGAPLRDIGGTIQGAAQSLIPTKEKLFDTMSAGPAGPMAKGMVLPAMERASKGDYSGAVGDLMGTGLAAMTPVAAEGVAKAAAPVIRGTASLAGRGIGAVQEKASDAWMTARNTPEQAIGRGIKPPRSNIGFFEKLERSVPEIKAVEPELGRPISGIDDLLEGAKLAKKKVRAQYDEIAGDKLSQIDGADIANATGNQDYFRTFSIEELEGRLKNVNAQLDTYYDKFPAARRAATAGNAETAGLVSEAKALRDTIYKALDPLGEGGAPAELQKRYGSIMDLEQEALKRRNVAARANPDSLTEQVGAVGAGMKIGKGLVRGLTGDFAGAASDIGSAAGGYGVSRAIKAANTTDALIKNAFKRYKKTPTPVEFTAQPRQAIPDPYGVRRMTPDQLRSGPPIKPTGPLPEFEMDPVTKVWGPKRTGKSVVPPSGPTEPPMIDPVTGRVIQRYQP